jgi:hypothetical protein
MFMSNDSWFPRFRYTQPGHASMYLWEGGGAVVSTGMLEGSRGT